MRREQASRQRRCGCVREQQSSAFSLAASTLRHEFLHALRRERAERCRRWGNSPSRTSFGDNTPPPFCGSLGNRAGRAEKDSRWTRPRCMLSRSLLSSVARSPLARVQGPPTTTAAILLRTPARGMASAASTQAGPVESAIREKVRATVPWSVRPPGRTAAYPANPPAVANSFRPHSRPPSSRSRTTRPRTGTTPRCAPSAAGPAKPTSPSRSSAKSSTASSVGCTRGPDTHTLPRPTIDMTPHTAHDRTASPRERLAQGRIRSRTARPLDQGQEPGRVRGGRWHWTMKLHNRWSLYTTALAEAAKKRAAERATKRRHLPRTC